MKLPPCSLTAAAGQITITTTAQPPQITFIITSAMLTTPFLALIGLQTGGLATSLTQAIKHQPHLDISAASLAHQTHTSGIMTYITTPPITEHILAKTILRLCGHALMADFIGIQQADPTLIDQEPVAIMVITTCLELLLPSIAL